MLNLRKIFPRHEDLFLTRYERLLAWALQLSNHDRELAEDLLHDAFIQFTFNQRDLDTIQNLDAYLYGMLRNLHLSQMRRKSCVQFQQLSIVEYESAEIGLRAIDPRTRIQAQEELRRICRYACLRKETAKAGSVLILRFFHGYYPSEIASILCVTRRAIDDRLRLARSEAKLSLENPKSLAFMGAAAVVESVPTNIARTANDFLMELRQTVFRSRQGECLSTGQLQEFYQQTDAAPMTSKQLGHIVSCASCMDEVNKLLKLPLLAERYPTDTLGKDSRPKDDPPDQGTPGSRAAKGLASKWRRDAIDTFEHKPQELRISVNGYVQGSQRISAELNEQTLFIDANEKINFVEVFSEQELRLLLFDIDEHPPSGSFSRSSRVMLSDARTLEATLSFSNPWPTLKVTYLDPLMDAESVALAEDDLSLGASDVTDSTSRRRSRQHESAPPRRERWILNALARFWRWFAHSNFWLRPGTVTAVLALILITVLVLVRMPVQPVSAAALLRRAVVAEESVAGNPDVVVHRTINLEERRAGGRDLIARQRIEVWQSTARGIKLRRLYDERNVLIAGERLKSDGTSTYYGRGMEPLNRTAPRLEAKALLESGGIWRLDPSAKDFAALVGRVEQIAVEEKPNSFALNYGSEQAEHVTGLQRATLTLNKNDLHAVEQTLIIKRDGEAREYHFVESDFDKRPANAVSPSVFQPEPELLGGSKETGDKGRGINARDDVNNFSAAASSARTTPASVELELEVTYLLNQIKANLGEQVSMTRTAEGALRVEAVVETQTRKEEILRALSPITGNPAVTVNVNTIAEALKRQQDQSKANGVVNREFEGAAKRPLADAELRSYFSSRLIGNAAIDVEINHYTNRVMSHSRQALLHASALKRLIERFPLEETRSLAPPARAKWINMVREHAQGCVRETSAVRQEVRYVFTNAPSGEAANEFVNENGLRQAAERLVQLSYANDEAVHSSFIVSSDNQTVAPIKSAQFWRTLKTAEKLATAILNVYQK